MTAAESRRPLEDMIAELVAGLVDLPSDTGNGGHPLRVMDVELSLPLETRVMGGPGGLVVHADMPARRTRTDFDLPLGRLVLRLAARPADDASRGAPCPG